MARGQENGGERTEKSVLRFETEGWSSWGELWSVELLVGTVQSVLGVTRGYLSGLVVSNPREQTLPAVTGDLTCAPPVHW